MGIRKFLGICEHQWTLVRQGVVIKTFFGGCIGKTHWSVHQCTKCCKLKKEQVNT